MSFLHTPKTTQTATLSLHDALPISRPAQKMPGVTVVRDGSFVGVVAPDEISAGRALQSLDRESRQLHSSHANNQYADVWYEKTYTKTVQLRCHGGEVRSLSISVDAE